MHSFVSNKMLMIVSQKEIMLILLGVLFLPKIMTVKIFSKPSDLHIIRKALDEKGVSPSLMEFVYIPNSYTQLNEEDTEKLLQMLEAFDEDCDVQNVFHSAEWRDSMVDNEGNG